ncbi:hypothetical protein ONZ45_g16735 [Pleurotus djamor]|nr:hypothetical protein ONZ45_g16735 [Pleurotus djamor]
MTPSPHEGKPTHGSHHRRTESLSVSPDGRVGKVKSVVVVGGSGVAGGAGESLMSIVEDVAKLNRSHTRSRSTSALNANYNADNGVDSASVQRKDSHGGLSEIVKAPPRVGRAELEREVSVSRGQVSPGGRSKEDSEAASFVIPRAPASIFSSTSSLPATTSTPARHTPSGVNGHGHGRIPSTSTTASAASQSSRLVHQAHPVYPNHGSPRGSLDSGVSASTGLSGLSGGSSRMPLKSALKKSPAQTQAMASHAGYLGPGTGSRSSSPSPLRVGVLLGSETTSGAAATELGEGSGEKRIDEEDEVDTKSLPVVDGEEEEEGADEADGDEVFLSADEGSSEGGGPTMRTESSRITQPIDKEQDKATTTVAQRKSLGTTKPNVPVVNGSSSTTNASRSTLVLSHPSSSPSSPMYHHAHELSDAEAVGTGSGSNSEPHRRKSVRVSLKPSYAAAPPPLPSPSPSSFEQERDGPHLHSPSTTPTPKASNSWGGRSNGEVVDMWKDASSDEDGDEDEEYEKAKRLLSMSMSGGGGDKSKGKSREPNGR